MGKKFEDTGYYLRSCCECSVSDRERLNLAVVSVEYPPLLLTSVETQEWEQVFGIENGRVAVSLIDHNYTQVRQRLCDGDVPLSKQALQAVAIYQQAIRAITSLANLFSQWKQYELFSLPQGHTVLVPRLSPEAAGRISVITEALSKKTVTRTLAGVKRNSKPRKRTPTLASEASQLYRERHERVKAASKDHTQFKNRSSWAEYVAKEDRKRTGKPKIPAHMIEQLPLKSAREISLDWTADELNKRHPNLGATGNTVRGLLSHCRTGTKRIQN